MVDDRIISPVKIKVQRLWWVFTHTSQRLKWFYFSPVGPEVYTHFLWHQMIQQLKKFTDVKMIQERVWNQEEILNNTGIIITLDELKIYSQCACWQKQSSVFTNPHYHREKTKKTGFTVDQSCVWPFIFTISPPKCKKQKWKDSIQ